MATKGRQDYRRGIATSPRYAECALDAEIIWANVQPVHTLLSMDSLLPLSKQP
jgi:hypothetical protein